MSGRGLLATFAAIEAVLAALAARHLDRDGFPLYLSLYFALSLPWLVSSYLALREKSSSRSDTALVLGIAALLRAFFLPTDPVLSDDVFRYVWDGRVQLAGTNPYRYAPDDPSLAPLKRELPEIYAGINNKDIPTIYPPLMQMLFYAAVSISSSVTWMKAFFTLFDLALVYTLMRLLEALGVNPLRAILYAWSPLPVVEVAGSGHNDVAAVFFFVAALWALERKRDASSIALVTASGLAKLAGFAILPFFARFVRSSALWAFALTTAITVLPYAPAGELAFRGLREYALRWRGNDSLFHLLLLLTGSLSSAKLVAASILAGLSLVLFWRKAPPARSSFWFFGAVLLLAPTAHPWYLLWMAPLLALFPHPAWLFLEVSVALSYHASYLASPGEAWIPVPGFKVLEYGPFFLLLGLHLALRWIGKGSGRSSSPSSVAS